MEHCFGKMVPVTAIIDAIYLWLVAMDTALMNASGHFSADKREERITFALSYARLYLFEPDYEQDDKSSDANTFDISCGGGRSRSSI